MECTIQSLSFCGAAMLPWLREDAIIRAMCDRLGTPDWRAAAADAAWAQRNQHAQALLTGLALAAWSQLAPALPSPTAVAGYSVGELAAFSVAGVFDAQPMPENLATFSGLTFIS